MLKLWEILLVSSSLFVCSHGKTHLPLDGFSRNSMFENFSKMYRENTSFFYDLTRTMGRPTLHEDLFTIIWYLAEFFLEWEMFSTKFAEENQRICFISNIFFRKCCLLWENVKNSGEAKHTTDKNKMTQTKYVLFMPNN